MCLLQTHENKYYYRMLNSFFSYFNAGTACSSYSTAEDYLGPTHLEWAWLTAAAVYTGCTLCLHSMYLNVQGRRPASESYKRDYVLAKGSETEVTGVQLQMGI